MRIIAGEFRSRLLGAPRGMETRPTSDRLRESLFNVLQPRLAGARFIDLYAGSGANGLEALSRGAAETVFVEQAAPALEALRKNVAMLGVGARARVEGLAVSHWLGNTLRSTEVRPFAVIFLDPPYEAAGEYDATLGLLGGGGAGLLGAGGVVIAEHRRVRTGGRSSGAGAVLAERYGTLQRTRVLEQGDAALSFYGRAAGGADASVQ